MWGKPDGRWSLFAGLGPLGALATAPRVARAFGTLTCASWGLGALSEDCELVLSELVANAVTAGSGCDGSPRYDQDGRLELLWVRLLSDGAQLLVECWDSVPARYGVPRLREAAETDEHGRGLELVSALSKDWGWDPLPGDGKRVWALLSR